MDVELIGEDSIVGAVFATATAYQRSAVLAAACRLGVFDALGDEPASAATIASAVEADVDATRVLLDALVGAGFVSVSPLGYSSPVAVRSRLGRDGDLATIVHKEALFARVWTDLDASIRDASPRLAPWAERLVSEPDIARNFLDALVVIATETGPDLTTLPEMAAGTRVLDIGGGLGSYARPLAAAGCAVTLVDLPVVAGWAREVLVDVPGITVADGDVRTDTVVPDGSHDVALVSHLLHDLPDADAATVLRAAVAAVRPGGHVVVIEIPGDVGPGPFGALFDLMMRVETPGRARPVDELLALMAAGGLGGLRRGPYSEPVVVLIGDRT